MTPPRQAPGPSASREEVLDFVSRPRFAGYQAITLPHGIRIPGQDKSRTAALVFSSDLRGKSVPDIGCNYGFFCHESARRGAARVVGVERDENTCRIAQGIARLMGNGVEIRPGRLEGLDPAERFDLVLLMSVLHHVTDPIAAVGRAAACCAGTLIVEFSLPTDPDYLSRLNDPSTAGRGLRNRLQGFGRSLGLRLLGRGLPLIAVGNVEYHRTFYFNPAAFRSLFMIHNRLFSRMEFRRSPARHRMLAFCDVIRPAAA